MSATEPSSQVAGDSVVSFGVFFVCNVRGIYLARFVSVLMKSGSIVGWDFAMLQC